MLDLRIWVVYERCGLRFESHKIILHLILINKVYIQTSMQRLMVRAHFLFTVIIVTSDTAT